jgi:putative PIN family toxin of toxin-antitoxin system
MCDTNVLVSLLLFPGVSGHRVMDALASDRLVLSQYIVDELRDVTGRKAPRLLPVIDELLADLAPEIAPAAELRDATALPAMRDPKDLPVLAGALAANVDILVTGDKDFAGLGLDKPLVLTPAEYVALRSEA